MHTREGTSLAPMVIRWDLRGEEGLTEAVRGRLAALEPGFGGQVRFAFGGDIGEGRRVAIEWGAERELRGTGPVLAAVARQLSPWVRHSLVSDPGSLALLLAPGDEQRPHLLNHLADGLALGLATERGRRFSFPCNAGSYEERDLTQPSDGTPEELASRLSATFLAELAEAFCRAERESGINATALAAIAAWQSAWGTSRMAREQQNPLAWGRGGTFATAAQGVLQVAGLIRRHYLEPSGADYYGSNLTGMNVAYVRDPMWRHGVAAIWRQLAEREPGR